MVLGELHFVLNEAGPGQSFVVDSRCVCYVIDQALTVLKVKKLEEVRLGGGKSGSHSAMYIKEI